MEKEIQSVTRRVYIGSSKAAYSLKTLKQYGITHIVNTTCEIDNAFPDDFSYLKLNLEDGNDHLISVLDIAYRYIISALKHPDSKIFVHCHMGISRSSSVVIYYIMKYFKLPYHRAYELVKKKRSKIQPNVYYEEQLRWLSKRMPISFDSEPTR